MKLFDLHCDTILDVHTKSLSLIENDLHIDLKKLSVFDTSVQCAAVWSNIRLSDEDAWTQFLAVVGTLDKQIANAENAVRVTTADEIRCAVEKQQRAFLLTCEDARILAGDLSRLDTMRALGVRILTLMWGGETCIGGSHDTEAPLTDFGRAVVQRCFEIGIVPDVSHASRAVTAEVISMAKAAGRPIVATHSNAFGVYPHTRNLTDNEARAIFSLGGVIGISMVPYHLTDYDNGMPCTLTTIAEHIEHYLSLGGENFLCLGCDFDGVGELPEKIENVSSLPYLAEALRARGIPEQTIQNIFFENAYCFALRTL